MKTNKDILIGKYLSGNASAKEQEQLQQWLEQDPLHRQEFEETEKLWSVASRLKKEKGQDAESAWEAFKTLAEASPVTKIRKLYLQPLKIAAGLALIVGTVLIARFFLSDPDPGSSSFVMHEQIQVLSAEPDPIVVAQAGDTGQVSSSTVAVRGSRARAGARLTMITVNSGDSAGIYVLPDGSKVYLNRGSELRFSANGRNIVLNGEAYFEVKSDTIPFYVTCKSTLTRALGTSFNVKGYASDTRVEVTVITGQVEFGQQKLASSKLLLKAGEQGIYNESHALVKSKSGKKDKWWKKSGLRSRIKQFFNKLKNKIN